MTSTDAATMQPMQRRQYTPEQRTEALQLLATVGKAEAARQTGIPPGTIASWGSRNGVRAVDNERVQAARQAWTERRVVLADTLGEVADQAAMKLLDLVQADDVSVGELTRALAVVVDRAQLLSGDATARNETTMVTRQQMLEEARERGAHLRAVS